MRLVPVGSWTAGHRRIDRPVRVLAGVTAVLASLVLVAGCRVPGMSSSAAMPTASGTIIVGASPSIGDAPLYIANQRGLFEKVGLNVRIVTYSSVRAELRDLQAHKIDVAYGDYANFFYAQAQADANAQKNKSHLDMVIVADGYDAAPNMMEVLTLPGSGIVTPKNLRGKSIGTPPADVMPSQAMQGSSRGLPYSLETVATQSVLNNDNVNPASITWQPLPPQDLISDLRSGQVDAILATEPTIFAAESQLGAVPVLDSCTGATASLPLGGYFGLRSFASAHHAAVVAFKAALERAQTIAGQAAPVRSTLQGSVDLSAEEASLVTLGQYPTSMSAGDLQRVVSLMFFFNVIPSINGEQLSVQNMIFH
jgi:NitT/TauT family transport system substrate-binding protein